MLSTHILQLGKDYNKSLGVRNVESIYLGYEIASYISCTFVQWCIVCIFNYHVKYTNNVGNKANK